MTSIPPHGAHLRGAVDLSSLVNRPAPQPGQPGVQAAPNTAPGAGTASVSLPSLVLEGTDSNFTEFIELSMNVPVLVDLWAEWCGPCKQLTPVLEKLVGELGGRLVLVKVDVDQNPQLAQAFQAQSIPTVAVLLGGRPMQLFTGAVPEAQVRDVLDRLLQVAAQSGVTGTVAVADAAEAAEGQEEPVEEPLPPLHQEAYDAIERADYPAAIDAYSKAIAQNPRDTMAAAGLAQVALLNRLSGKTLDQVRNAAASDPASVEAQLDVADLDVSGGHIDDAFDRLLTLFAALDSDSRDAVRERLLELFEVVGTDDPRVMKARARLTGMLY